MALCIVVTQCWRQQWSSIHLSFFRLFAPRFTKAIIAVSSCRRHGRGMQRLLLPATEPSRAGQWLRDSHIALWIVVPKHWRQLFSPICLCFFRLFAPLFTKAIIAVSICCRHGWGMQRLLFSVAKFFYHVTFKKWDLLIYGPIGTCCRMPVGPSPP